MQNKKNNLFEIINHRGYVHPRELVLVYIEESNGLIQINLNPDDQHNDINYFFSYLS